MNLLRPVGPRAPAHEGDRPPGVPQGRTLHLPGRGSTWVVEAPGPPGAPSLLLLHGLGATGSLNWGAAFPSLAGRYRVVAIDHRGHGRGMRTNRFRLVDCADDAAAVVEQLDLGPTILVGYSMGGPIAALAWRRHRQMFAGLVFCATSRNFRGKPAERLGFAALAAASLSPLTIPGFAVRTATSLLAQIPIPGDGARHWRWTLDELGGHDVRSLVQAAAELGRFDARSWISQIEVPTAVVTTTGDHMVSPRRQASLAMAVPTAVIHPVDAGHMSAGRLVEDGFVDVLVEACDEVNRRANRGRMPEPPGGATKTVA